MHSLSIDLVPERRRMRATGIEADFREAEGMKMELKLTDLTMK
jgi:hypothetical protein